MVTSFFNLFFLCTFFLYILYIPCYSIFTYSLHSYPSCFHTSIFVRLLPPLQYLYQGVCTDDLAAILCAKVHGGDINFVNVDDEGKTPMLIAIEKVYTIHNYVVNSYKLDSFFKGKSASYRHYSVIYV